MLSALENMTRGIVVFMHGSSGIARPNLRVVRMLSGLGYLVIAPDSMATSWRRFRALRQDMLRLDEEDMDYWSDNLFYTSGAVGPLNYSSSVDAILADPDAYQKLFEAVYRERARELHQVLLALPRFARRNGVHLVGMSEGAAVCARFDERKGRVPVRSRSLLSACLEYCYFTPTPQAAQLGGSLQVPTLNVVGDSDPFFGEVDSIAQKVAADPKGYGTHNFTGNGFCALSEQQVKDVLVVVPSTNQHDLTRTHDDLLRQLLGNFLQNPIGCARLGAEWCQSPDWTVNVEQSKNNRTLLRLRG